jgi:hypothetical protein
MNGVPTATSSLAVGELEHPEVVLAERERDA